METVTNAQLRMTDASCDAVDRTHVSDPPSAMEENDPEPYSQTNSMLGKGDVSSRADPVDEVNAPNVIIFGEAGVGKSSVINLIAGRKLAHISNDALGCTFQHQRYTVTLEGMPFAFWDTTGLDEGSEGRVPAELAERNLRELIGKLAHSGGIHLVIYCIRGTRLTRALKHNYELFYVNVCRKKVPVALVVTGLEYQEESMETWWDENEGPLVRYGMRFDAHACVTTLDVDDADIWARRSDSQKRLRELVLEYAERRPWKIEASMISWTMLHNVLVGVVPMAKKTTPRVIIYDETAPCRKGRRWIGDRQLECEVVHINDPFAGSISGTSAGVTVLVFYTSTLDGAHISSRDIATLRRLYNVTGGKTCRVIVVLRGCNDDQIAQNCRDAIASEVNYRDIRACSVVDEQGKLDTMIEAALSSRLYRAYETIIDSLLAALACLPDLLMSWQCTQARTDLPSNQDSGMEIFSSGLEQ